MSLLVAPCSSHAARFACERWHYLGKFPSFRTARFGVWENDAFVGAVVFSHPLPPLRATFGVEKMRIVELARVALTEHRVEVSRVIAVALRTLFRENPRIRLVVSFADTGQGHTGGIYQAGGWIYTGLHGGGSVWMDGLTKVHDRVRSQKVVNGEDVSHLHRKPNSKKHRYVKLGPSATEELEKLVESMRQPYPKRTKSSSEAVGFQPTEGGAIPTRALQTAVG